MGSDRRTCNPSQGCEYYMLAFISVYFHPPFVESGFSLKEVHLKYFRPNRKGRQDCGFIKKCTRNYIWTGWDLESKNRLQERS